MTKEVDVLIVGGGVTGTALAYRLSQENMSIVLLEKNERLGEVNSHPLNNSQTSHDGGTETNYDLDHALKVKHAATLLRQYVEREGGNGLFRKTQRMVLAVGSKEVEALCARFEQFKGSYPDLRLIEREEIAAIEPAVVRGRDPDEQIVALVSSEGYAIDYQQLAQSFAGNSHASFFLGTTVLSVERKELPHRGLVWCVTTSKGQFLAKVVVFAAGPYSLLFAQRLGYGTKYGLLPVAGSFYSAGTILRNKVYRVQVVGRPFAEIHGDPDILNTLDTRFGPTTKPLPLMERHHYETFWDFLRLPTATVRGVKALFKVLLDNGLFGYVCKNVLYDLPVIGKALFLREARVIVPSLSYFDLKVRRGAGGIRPQLVDLETGKLLMGDATIVGDNIIFNTTPSPGASVCLANAERDTAIVLRFLEGNK